MKFRKVLDSILFNVIEPYYMQCSNLFNSALTVYQNNIKFLKYLI
jgi:hypothetical protein